MDSNTNSQATAVVHQNPSPKKHNGPSHGKTKPLTKNTLVKNASSRNEKRARWAKRSKPIAKPVAPRKGPEKEYISACCNVPARKPRAGQKVSNTDPETGKLKTTPKGLGHWRCEQCNKPCKVTPQKPQPKTEVPVAQP